MRKINPTRSEGVDGDVWERLLADIRGHIWTHGDFKKLAVSANLSVATVSKLAYGDTNSPHMRTVVRIMEALGKSDPVLEAFRADKSVSTVQAFARKLKVEKVRQKRKDDLQKKIHPHRITKVSRRGTSLH